MAVFNAVKLLLPAALASLASAKPEPKPAKWSSKTYGPDGPWNAVEVKIGSSEDPVALFPGRVYQTYVITSDYCAYNTSVSHCVAGTYSKDSAIEADLAGIQYQPGAAEYLSGIQVVGNQTKMFMDEFDMGFEGGTIPDASMALLESQMLAYPDGTWYPLFAGCLSLGAAEINQSYSQRGDNPPINASIIPWYLSEDKRTPSSSFGMHLGSAASNSAMDGSLIYGGYDRNRVVGDVLEFKGDISKTISLKDIGIQVIKGDSPFDFNAKGSLLASGNDSISSGLSVVLDACSPYLTLPKSTCDSIAANLPINYQRSLGLYLWDTSDPSYEKIVSSASALTFTFESDSEELTIKVPFRHLNLTLEAPLVDVPTPYFPCSTGGNGAFVLGRAFFQDAFMGANWGNKRWWLAQAPGPKFEPDSNIVSILSDETTIYSGSNNWESSWDGVWKASISEDDGGGAGKAGGAEEAGDENGGTQGSGLSTGAKVGIGVGAGLGALALAIMAFLFWRRRSRKRAPEPTAPAQEAHYVSPVFGGPEKAVYQPYGPSEVASTSLKGSGGTSELAGDERHYLAQNRQDYGPGHGHGPQELP